MSPQRVREPADGRAGGRLCLGEPHDRSCSSDRQGDGPNPEQSRHETDGHRRRVRGGRLEQIPRITDIPQSSFRILLETPADQPLDRRRDATEVRLVLDDRRNRVGHGVTAEGFRTGDHFVQHAAERPDVGPTVDAVSACLFGRHVRGHAKNHPGLRHRGCCDRRRHRHAWRRTIWAAISYTPRRVPGVRPKAVNYTGATTARGGSLFINQTGILPKHLAAPGIVQKRDSDTIPQQLEHDELPRSPV